MPSATSSSIIRSILAVGAVVIAGCSFGTKCPSGMVSVGQLEGQFCIHQYEASLTGELGNLDQGQSYPDGSTAVTIISQAGLTPTKTSWYQAYAACELAGFHLCTSAEWEDACDDTVGPGGMEYPTPDGSYDVALCPIGDFRAQKQADLGLSGESPNCHTRSGVHDMLGNLWEWTNPVSVDGSGLPQIDKRGGGHYGAEPVSCDRSAVGTHSPSFEGTIGFRCCSAPM
jgi:formylglycine-generating enzyme required for sulfatase activity